MPEALHYSGLLTKFRILLDGESVPEKKVLYLIKKKKKEQIQLKKEINYGKHSNDKTFRGGGRVI